MVATLYPLEPLPRHNHWLVGPTDPAFYRPLRRLDLPDGTRFVAGLLHEGRSVDELRPLLADVESLLGQ